MNRQLSSYPFHRQAPDFQRNRELLNTYGYRDYDPQTGRWTARDPIAEQGGLNLYAMVGNDAVWRVDMLGREPLYTLYGEGLLRGVIDSNVPHEGVAFWGGVGRSGALALPPYQKHYPCYSKGNCMRYAFKDPIPYRSLPDGRTELISGDPLKEEEFLTGDGELNCDLIAKFVVKKGAIEKKGKNCPACHYEVMLAIRLEKSIDFAQKELNFGTIIEAGYCFQIKYLTVYQRKRQKQDYHWYKQDNDSTWSHKPGQTPVILGIANPEVDAFLNGYSSCMKRFCVPIKGIDLDS